MAAIVLASAPRPTRIVTPSTSTSIIPTWGSVASQAFAPPAKRGRHCVHIHHCRHKLQFFRFRMRGRSFSQLTAPARPHCCGDKGVTPHRRGPNSPLAPVSATIRALSSLLHFRRRPAPVKTSSRRTGSGASTTHCVHSKLNGQNQTANSQNSTSPESGRKTSLTKKARDCARCLGHALDVIGEGIGHHETDRCRAGYRSLPVFCPPVSPPAGWLRTERFDMARWDA